MPRCTVTIMFEDLAEGQQASASHTSIELDGKTLSKQTVACDVAYCMRSIEPLLVGSTREFVETLDEVLSGA